MLSAALDHSKMASHHVALIDLKSDTLFIEGLDWLAATVRVGTWLAHLKKK